MESPRFENQSDCESYIVDIEAENKSLKAENERFSPNSVSVEEIDKILARALVRVVEDKKSTLWDIQKETREALHKLIERLNWEHDKQTELVNLLRHMIPVNYDGTDSSSEVILLALAQAITKLFLESLPEKIHITPGKDCICHAHSPNECGCEADWTDYSTWNDCLDQITKEFKPTKEGCDESQAYNYADEIRGEP